MTFEVGIHTFGDIVADPDTGTTPSPRQRTRIRLTSAVTVLSTLDPVRVFEDYATLDLISDGRAEIIAGRGSTRESFPLFGWSLDDYAALFEEKLGLLLAVRDGSPVSWVGRFRPALEKAEIVPRPAQDVLPIYVGVGGTPSSGARAGRLGLPLAYGVLLGRVDDAVPVGEAYAAAAAEAGHDASTLRKTIAGHGFVARTSQAAHDTLYKYFTHGMNEFARSQGKAGPPMSRAAFAGQTSPQGALMSGSPQEVIDKLMLQHDLYGNDRVMIYMGLGGVPQREHLQAIELLGSDVAPVLRKELAVRA